MKPLKVTKKDIVAILEDEFVFGNVLMNSIVTMTLDLIRTTLIERGTVELRDLGVFDCKLRASRVGRNPNRPTEPITIPKRYAICFRPSKKLRASIKGYEEVKIAD
jgi:nucleoid DNA-binding protein